MIRHVLLAYRSAPVATVLFLASGCATSISSVSVDSDRDVGQAHASEEASSRTIDVQNERAEIFSQGADLPPPESIWDYLTEKYDRDNNGLITAAEYDRGEDAFDRLDRDNDGAVTANDLKVSSGRGGQAETMALLAVSLHFQADDDADEVTRQEVEESFEAYDQSSNGRIDAKEFADIREDRRVRPPRTMRRVIRRMEQEDPFNVILDATDQDEDQQVSREELLAYFSREDRDGNGMLEMPGTRKTNPRGRIGRGSSRGPSLSAGAKEGEPAPDFTLSPTNIGIPVTLSSFRGQKPVALIFGSYT